MKRYALLLGFLVIAAGAFLATSGGDNALAQEASPPPEALQKLFPGRPYSPYAGGAVPTQVYWGDTHLHTSVSMDAGAFGARLSPEDAYRFARGERSTFSSWRIIPTVWGFSPISWRATRVFSPFPRGAAGTT